ncbi:MAG: tetratricopeptide repeat protein [Bradymonadaceae bacterium]
MATVLSVWPDVADARSLRALERESDDFISRIQRLERRYLKPALLESKFKIESQFNDGRVAYLMEDYARASLLLVDVVRDPSFEQFDSHREALYMLADSLYQQRNYLAAKKYFEQLVKEGGGEHYQDAIIRLLEIASKTDSYQRVDELYDQFNRQKKVRPAVEYVRGKTLFEQEKFEKALPFFERSQKDDRFRLRATYYLGVCQAASGDLEAARATFEGLLEQNDPTSERGRRLEELTQMALGRVAYEQKRYKQAVEYYDRLPRKSPYYDRALYETTWVHVAAGNYEAASRNADIFLLLEEPKQELLADMRLLRADLLLRRDKFKRASSAYRQVKQTFSPVVSEMGSLLARQDDVRAYFEELVSRELAGEDPSYLPPKARRWVDETEQMNDLETMVEDIASMERDIEQAKQDLREIEARLASGSRIKSFPKMAEGMAVAIEAHSSLLTLRRELLEKEFRVLRPKMSSAERRKWRELRKELEAFEKRYKAIPKTRRAIQKRDRKLEKRFDKLAGRLDRLSRAIEYQRQQLNDVQTYLEDHSLSQYPEKTREKIKRLRKEVENNIARLKKRKRAIKQQVSVARQKVGMGDEVTQREQKMRRKYEEMIRERKQFLAKLHGRVGASRRKKLRRIQRAREPLPRASDRLRRFFDEMRRLVDERSRQLIATARAERQRLDKRSQRLAALKDSSTDTMASLAEQNYRKIKKHFEQLVLRGDVGLIDVAWRKKENRTKKINQVRAEHKAELKNLQEQFDKLR